MGAHQVWKPGSQRPPAAYESGDVEEVAGGGGCCVGSFWGSGGGVSGCREAEGEVDLLGHGCVSHEIDPFKYVKGIANPFSMTLSLIHFVHHAKQLQS